MRDLVHNLGLVSAITPAVLAADNVPVAIDLLGFDSALIAINLGAGGITFTATNKIEFLLTHSDDDTTYVPVTDADLQGVTGITSGIILALKTLQAAPSIFRVGYKGGRRYLKLLADFSGTHGTGTPISAMVIKGNASQRPVA